MAKINWKTQAEIEAEKNAPRPLTNIEQLQLENANLMFQNAIQDVNIGNLQKENADLLFKIAMLEVNANV